jgi:hypothetical protein
MDSPPQGRGGEEDMAEEKRRRKKSREQKLNPQKIFPLYHSWLSFL